MNNRFYISTPIYYTNGEPHIGHAYTTLAADTIARYHRLAGEETFFLTGTDEHGIKMVKTAADKGVTPAELTERNVAVFKQFWGELGITHDDFIRTTSERHKSAVQEIVRRLLANDDIYLGAYEGWYDEGQEEFVTETEAKNNNYKSAISGRALVRYKEPTWYFRLSKYAPAVLKHIEENPTFVQPDSRRNEVLSKLKQGVDDLSISRATLKWGIPLPNDPEHVIYVWIDALSNYITALGYASADEGLFKKFWPVNVHLIGKEILWFHAVYWPAMLLGLGLPLPKQVFAHGWWVVEGKKMSKSEGNFIDIEKLRSLISTHSVDAVRYYLLRAAPFGSDLDWTEADFNKAFTELGNVLGNCLNRTLKMVNNYRGGAVPAASELNEQDQALIAAADALPEKLADAYGRCALQEAALLPLELARACNGYIDSTAPWGLAKDPANASRLDVVLNVCTYAIYRALVGFLPMLPNKAAAGLAQLGVDVAGKTLAQLLASAPGPGHKLNEGQPLFPRIK